ncbi:site-specific integrase [Dysgonomonas sp. GY75]|uniref:site-specific integrase n=1 Tax=Dysgonomonas sp. GY75 TaxID=2780419 RepID=UPI001883ACA1|nr:site-specific integrase [Dysgonomonas sp. GY75]MBF0649293.1 site-specific integrase [Dysgonomonas sp. GY75]
MATLTRVHLRQRDVTRGRISLYLDYYPAIRDPHSMKMTRREYLGIYIYAKPRNEFEKEFNNEMLMKAEAIRSIRVQSIINEEFGFLDKNKAKADFLIYFKTKAEKKDQKWMKVYLHFSNFVKGKCAFGQVSVDLCNRFRDYLQDARQLKNKNYRISQNSASGYFSTFRALLKVAYKEKFFRENLNDFLDSIETTDVKKEYLTLDEVKLLANTPCDDYPILKTASLFSCMTGLRISDILKLDWKEIEPASDGGYCMRLRIEKTETETTLPISDEALDLCGKRGKGKVFRGLQRSMTQQPLKAWVASAGITKHITFHCFRHTFATLQIALGTDIYTVSKMLTHKNVSTTQIYADLVSSKKRESANKISLK